MEQGQFIQMEFLASHPHGVMELEPSAVIEQLQPHPHGVMELEQFSPIE
jgi:hypothetical protein